MGKMRQKKLITGLFRGTAVVVAKKQSLFLNELTDLHEILHASRGKVTLEVTLPENLRSRQTRPFFFMFP